jgi:hypothetical protein
MADFVFGPGEDTFRANMRLFLNRRGASSPPARRRITNVQRFIEFLDATVPAGDTVAVIYLSTHGNERAAMSIDLDVESRGETPSTRTDADEVLAAIQSGSVDIADRLIGTPPTEVRIRGCRVGQSAKFMRLLRQAFGDNVPVIAPVHFNVAGLLDGHSYEFFLHADYVLTSPTSLGDRAAVRAAFVTRNFTKLDGTTVLPATFWDTVLPPASWGGWTSGGIRAARITAPLGQTIGRRTTAPTGAEFRHEIDRFTLDWGTRIAASTPQADIRTELENGLGPEFQPSHQFPVFERYGFASLTDFLAAFEWTPRNASGGGSTVTGRRHIYLALAPVLDPATDTLLFNFQPSPGSAVQAQTNVPESDARIFAASRP